MGEIDAAAVEEAVGGAPALLIFMDLHTAVATRRALGLAGVDAPQALDDGSEFAGRDGALTGEVREMGAILTALDAIPDPPGAERFARVRRVLDRLHAVGITGVHAMDGSPATYDFLAELEAHDELTMRMVVPLWQKPDTSDDDMRAQLPLRDARGRLWRGGVAKFFVDGGIESGTAWLERPDTLGAGTQELPE